MTSVLKKTEATLLLLLALLLGLLLLLLAALLLLLTLALLLALLLAALALALRLTLGLAGHLDHLIFRAPNFVGVAGAKSNLTTAPGLPPA